MILAIDFDGVIHNRYRDGYGILPPSGPVMMGPPIEGTKNAMDYLRGLGHTLIVFSVWGDSPALKEWLDYFSIPYDECTNLKPRADIYLDDRGVRFTTWSDFLNGLALPSHQE